MIKGLFLCVLFLFVQSASALSNKDLRDSLFTAASANHHPISYKVARKNLFGSWYLQGKTSATYAISTFYCHETLMNKDFPVGTAQLGPLLIPDINILNAEHSWPQSKFTSKFSKDIQKGDLHILFPVLSQVNSIRGNFPYGEVKTPMNVPCPDAALGKSAEGMTVFEPNDEDKGDVARAIFYFSVRYQAPIDPTQEKYLRAWHAQDPVGPSDILRNETIFSIQNNRNPFVDNPELVDQIANF